MHLVWPKPWLLQSPAIMTTGPQLQYVHLSSSTCTAPLSDLSISQYANYKFYCKSLTQTGVTSVWMWALSTLTGWHLHAQGAHTGGQEDWYLVNLNMWPVTSPSACAGRGQGIWDDSRDKQSADMVHRYEQAPRMLRQTIQYQSGASFTMGIEDRGIEQGRDSIHFYSGYWMNAILNTE